MAEWKFAELKSLCRLITKGTTPTTIGGHFTESGVNFIKSESIGYDGTIDASKFTYIDTPTNRQLKRSQIADGDILYSIAGVHLGKCASARKEHLPANTNQAVAIIRVDSEHVVSKFVEYVLRNRSFVEEVNAGVAQSAQPNVNLTEIGRFQIPLPPKTEQAAIAATLGALDDKIELNRRMNETLEAIARAVFKSWFVDFDPVRDTAEGRKPYGMTDATAALFSDSFDESPLGKIPKGWAAVPLPAAFDVNPPRSLAKGTVAPYLDMANMPTTSPRAREIAVRPFGSGVSFSAGDTLIARITPCLENGKTAFVDFLEDGEVGWGSTEYIVLRSKPPLPLEYAYFLSRSADFRAHAILNIVRRQNLLDKLASELREDLVHLG